MGLLHAIYFQFLLTFTSALPLYLVIRSVGSHCELMVADCERHGIGALIPTITWSSDLLVLTVSWWLQTVSDMVSEHSFPPSLGHQLCWFSL
jgi:hypothetical protein